MKILSSISIAILICLVCSCTREQPKDWQVTDNPILTRWSADVNPLKPWPEYPRPDMKRDLWLNLNGLWEYAITPVGNKPDRWEGNILVPYPVESALSGVKRRVSDTENLWYRRTFKVPSRWKKKQIMLNFEACDWETVVWVDGNEVGTHRGGYDPFSMNISKSLNEKNEHELIIRVWDPTNKSTQPRGKQVNSPGGIWYTPSTGIWQTVWIEPLNNSYISSFRTVTDADNGTISVIADINNPETTTLNLEINQDGKNIVNLSGISSQMLTAKIENPILWSPDNPFLYDITLQLKQGNKTLDEISSQTGIRKISLGKTEDGYTRMMLNNKFIFQNGPLDQGFWPDGIYTPPTEKAMLYDIEMTKKMGFNMLRKHVKVENRIFYYWCDKLGILVWQDMPSGDKSIGRTGPDIDKSTEATQQFEFELKRMIDTKYNHPSIIMWVPFNEGWGQFETARITQLISEYDTTRLVNSASGWTDRGTGDINDIHHYPDPVVQDAEENRAIVLGEFGGLGLPLQGHTWEQKNWGYRNMEDTLQLLSKYEQFYDQVHQFVAQNGLSATIYTQTTDVETETNGLMTYDRAINKMGVENVFKANHNIIPPSLSSQILFFTDSYTLELKNTLQGGKIYFTTDGSEPTINSTLYTNPIVLTETTNIRVFTKWNDTQSRIANYLIEKKIPIPSLKISKLKSGLKASIYNGNFSKMPDFDTLKPTIVKNVQTVSHTVAEKKSFYAIVFEGYLDIPEDGVYELSVNSDDGSSLTIDDTEKIMNDGIHGMREAGNLYPLQKGYHKIRIDYFQAEGGVGLEFLVSIPGQAKMLVPITWLKN